MACSAVQCFDGRCLLLRGLGRVMSPPSGNPPDRVVSVRRGAGPAHNIMEIWKPEFTNGVKSKFCRLRGSLKRTVQYGSWHVREYQLGPFLSLGARGMGFARSQGTELWKSR